MFLSVNQILIRNRLQSFFDSEYWAAQVPSSGLPSLWFHLVEKIAQKLDRAVSDPPVVVKQSLQIGRKVVHNLNFALSCRHDWKISPSVVLAIRNTCEFRPYRLESLDNIFSAPIWIFHTINSIRVVINIGGILRDRRASLVTVAIYRCLRRQPHDWSLSSRQLRLQPQPENRF